MSVASCGAASCTAARLGENVRTVATKRASSGITLSAVPAWKVPTVTTTGSKTSNCRVTIVCSAGHDLAGHGDRVGRVVRLRAVPAAPVHGHVQRVSGRHHRPGPAGEHAERQQAGRHVQRVGRDRPLAGRVQHALLDHEPAAAGALLAGLEHEDDVPGQLGLARGQQPRRPGQHRGVQVVAAGVHGAGDPRGVGQAGALGHRQRVHVAAQQHGLARPAAAQHRGHRAERLRPAVISSGSPSRASSTLRWVRGRSSPISGSAWIGVAQLGELAGDRDRLVMYSGHRPPSFRRAFRASARTVRSRIAQHTLGRNAPSGRAR